MGSHDTALYAVVGDFNDTPASPWVNPVLTSPHLTDVLATHLPATERWTYCYRSKYAISQIDQVFVSKTVGGRIADVVAADREGEALFCSGRRPRRRGRIPAGYNQS
jgi:hypothetical protein